MMRSMATRGAGGIAAIGRPRFLLIAARDRPPGRDRDARPAAALAADRRGRDRSRRSRPSSRRAAAPQPDRAGRRVRQGLSASRRTRRARVRLRGRRHGHPSGARRQPLARGSHGRRARRSIVNAMGLPEPRRRGGRGHLAPRPTRTGTSVRQPGRRGRRRSPSSSLELLEPLVDGVELNASCPNVSWGRDGDNEAHLRALVEALPRPDGQAVVREAATVRHRRRSATSSCRSRRLARDAGADGLTCSNTRLVADDAARRSGAAGSRARRSGRTRRASSARCATAVGDGPSRSTRAAASRRPRTSRTCLEAGATTVQIYSAFDLRGPGGRSRRGSTLGADGRHVESPVLRRG